MAETWKRVAFTEDIVPPNLITNSGFGCWSQSDTNKGLGVMNYDGGSYLSSDPVAGETVTGEISGAVGKIISITIDSGTFNIGNAAGTIVLGACAGRFQDNEAIFFVGSYAYVNMPNSAPGVDLIQNGDFSVDTDPPPGWTSYQSAVLTTEGSGQVGNCLMITEGGESNPRAQQTIIVEPGKLYTLSWWVKQGTESTWKAHIYGTNFGYVYINGSGGDEATSSWVNFTYTFESLDAYIYFGIHQICAAAAGTTIYFDEISCYEITPCCTGANSNGPDSFAKDTTLDIYRVHNDGGTNTKDGSFYSLLMVPSAQADFLKWPADSDNPEWYQQFAGRDIVRGLWIKSSTASDVRLSIYDGIDTTYSDYHTGGGDWEWLKVKATINAAPTELTISVVHSNATPGPAYISQPQLSFGTTLPEGGYTYRPGEWVSFGDNYIDLGVKTTPLAADDKILNLEALSEGRIPKGAKAVNLDVRVSNSSVTTAQGVTLKTGTATISGVCCNPVVNNMQQTANGIISCDSNGDIYQEITEADATLSGYSVYVNGVQVSP